MLQKSGDVMYLSQEVNVMTSILANPAEAQPLGSGYAGLRFTNVEATLQHNNERDIRYWRRRLRA